jgi:hypothetical protein
MGGSTRKHPIFGYECLEDFLADVRDGVADKPYLYDGDYYCPKCGEPWDAYGVKLALKGEVSDMTREDALRFMRGEGCPVCEYGKKIPKWKNEEH